MASTGGDSGRPTGQVIATGGEGYSSKAAAQSGIESVKRVAESAPLEEAQASS